jgi:hypothetical protein
MKPFLVCRHNNELDIVVSSGASPGILVPIMNTPLSFRKRIQRREFEVIGDSGIFAVDKKIGQPELFQQYEECNLDYGIMQDVYKDADATIRMCREAKAIHDAQKYRFSLVAVVQGKSVMEYQKCLHAYLEMGIDKIAIGGLLKNGGFTREVDGDLLMGILCAFRKQYNGWLFALGAYSPKRLLLLQGYDCYGADTSGWVFRYRKGRRKSDLRRQIIAICAHEKQMTFF